MFRKTILWNLLTVTAFAAAPKAYVTNFGFGGSTTLSVIDTTNETVVSTVDVGRGPLGVTASRDGTRIFVANHVGGSVSVVDTQSNAVIGTILVDTVPGHIAATPDGAKGYVTREGAHAVAVLDLLQLAVIGSIGIRSPVAAASSPAGDRIYVTSHDDRALYIVNTATDAVSHVVPLEGNGLRVAVSADGTHAYVTTRGPNSVKVVDTQTLSVVDSIFTGDEPWNIRLSPDGARAFVGQPGSGVAVLDLISNTVTAHVAVFQPACCLGLDVTPDGNRLYVVNRDGNNVSVLDATSFELKTTIPVGNGPLQVAISPGSPTALAVRIDIRPGSSTNPVNTQSQGLIPVAILSASDFDAAERIDVASLTFGATGGEASFVRCASETEDTNADGWNDLICFFSTPKTGFFPGAREGALQGETRDGDAFRATDAVLVQH